MNEDDKTFSRPKSAIIGASLGIFGFIIQFVGLRGLHWTVSVAQLLAMFLATALRISIRTVFAHSMRCIELKNPFELEWLTNQIDNTRPLLGAHIALTGNSHVDPGADVSRAVDLRMQLGVIADSNGWDSAFREEAYRLHETIDEFVNMLWSEKVVRLHDEFKAVESLDFMIDLCPTRNCTTQGFSISIQRSKVPGMFTPWSTNPRQIEAYLALWTYELQRQATHMDANDQEPFNSPRRCVWKSCGMTAQSAMDFDWWVRRGYSYYRTPRAQFRSPLTCSDKLPTAESPFCDDESIPTPTQLLTVATHCSISCLCARYIFALFLRRALKAIRNLDGVTSIRPADNDSAREIIGFQHTAVESLSRTIARRGLMTPQDSYVLLIPALRQADLLPNPLNGSEIVGLSICLCSILSIAFLLRLRAHISDFLAVYHADVRGFRKGARGSLYSITTRLLYKSSFIATFALPEPLSLKCFGITQTRSMIFAGLNI